MIKEIIHHLTAETNTEVSSVFVTLVTTVSALALIVMTIGIIVAIEDTVLTKTGICQIVVQDYPMNPKEKMTEDTKAAVICINIR